MKGMIRIAAPALVLAALVSVATDRPALEPPAAMAVAQVQGDVNCGGTINAIDALQVLRYSAGLSANAACITESGNTNCDAAINSVDALRILRHSAALPNSVPQGCTPIGALIPPPEPAGPTSYELIDAALQAGEIDAETAHKYRVFAAFGDSQLPAEYRGDDGGGKEPPDIVEDAFELMDTFSAQTQAELAPFFEAPGRARELDNAGDGERPAGVCSPGRSGRC